MSIKLVVTDMDGTFLDGSSKISEKNMEAVRKLSELGIHFSPVTGRGTPGLLQFQPILEQKEPCVTYNGCMVVDPVTGEILYHLTLTESDARKVVSLAKEMDANLFIWSNNKPYTLADNEAKKIYERYAGMPIEVVDSVEPLIKQGVTKFLLLDGIRAHADRWQAAYAARAEEFDSICVVMSGDGFLDIFNSNASKGTAVEELARSYGISREEIIALGDGFNDVPMLEYAGLGIAMANSEPDVQARADYVTGANTEDGVAQALEKFVFSKL